MEKTMRFSFILLLTLSFSILAQEQAPVISQEPPIIHQIYQLVDQRNPQAKVFTQALKHPELAVRKAALTGLGRIGGKAVIDMIVPFIDSEEQSLRQLAAFALGISGNKESAYYLWQQLAKETSSEVKHEIYLGLGNLGQNNLITKMMARLVEEKSIESQASLFQGLGIALTFHSNLKDNFKSLNFSQLLNQMSQDNKASPSVGLFLSRIPDIENLITAADILPLTQKDFSPLTTQYLARLIGKITSKDHTDNRALLAWVIEKSEDRHIGVQLEAIRALKNLLNVPQAQIQIGKLHASKTPIIAQTSLNVIANSTLNTKEAIDLLKKQLKSPNSAMVVDAISGLIKRQEKEEMSWVVKLFPHPDPYVKINLMSLLKQKSENDYANLIRFFTQDPQKEVSQYAQRLSANKKTPEVSGKSPDYQTALNASSEIVKLNTTVGEITIQLLAQAPYTSWHFINNIRQGYYNGSYFNRVIGNFVAQGGDSIGDGNGSSGKTIREEINFLPHQPMTVGMATAGKDTGSSQFFINTARNLHLDRNYTVFGRVISGQDNVLKMTHGTQIISATIQ